MNGRHWSAPADRVNGTALPRTTRAGTRALITGGAGFIATNVAARLLDEGADVVLLDNMSRKGVEHNAAWLIERYGSRVRLLRGDVCDARLVARALDGVREVYHFAAQVAVTTSLTSPIADFETNARGTLTLLEALRVLPGPPSLLFTSTNKVYGDLEDLALVRDGRRYVPADPEIRHHGISERRLLAFHSPYGCSKGAADQYVLDYARTFGLPAVVFRMSCIYGPHQFGTEDQGWVAHFLLRALNDDPITIYGDGCQVRDILFAEDLVDAMLTAQTQIDVVSGRAFNIGGGPQYTVSLLELVEMIDRLLGRATRWQPSAWRAADQRYYVSDFRQFTEATGWRPRVPVDEGLRRLLAWLTSPVEPAAAPIARTVAAQ
ncbi:MAG TPA: NAD-dependent epimerase/dehydratase family protein [Vicinamibacterales bacterium]